MKKKQPWYSFWLIVPALIALPPLGLILLWKSPRTSRAKLAISVLYVVFLTGAFVGAIRTGMYERYISARQPSGDVFDVRMDSRNAYISNEVLPFERKVFAAVIRTMRADQQPQDLDLKRDIVDIDSISRGTNAFQAVADEYNLDYDDVQKIYRKVSCLLSKKIKK